MNGQPMSEGLRLLPWCGTDDKPCYLLGEGSGYVSRVADHIEHVQLDMADELLDHAGDMIVDSGVTSDQLRYLAVCLAEALRDVRRIAESRGARLTAIRLGSEAVPPTPHGREE
ncbi:hypothetical protein [Streptomyces sp. NPDC003077]|uniref:hypothetical protein n=1 Tax=Streptomyces sp. NPDC003077 TaxID=3154443 RepID=UPI0033A34B95